MQTLEQREKILDQTRSYKFYHFFSFGFLPADFDIFLLSRSQHVYDIVLCVYERFRVDGLKRYVNDDRFRVDGDKNMRLLAFAFTIVFVWTGPKRSFTLVV